MDKQRNPFLDDNSAAKGSKDQLVPLSARQSLLNYTNLDDDHY